MTYSQISRNRAINRFRDYNAVCLGRVKFLSIKEENQHISCQKKDLNSAASNVMVGHLVASCFKLPLKPEVKRFYVQLQEQAA